MKNISISLFILALIFSSLSAFADDSKHSHETEQMGDAQQIQHESMSTSVEQMRRMREHMMNSDDPTERQKMMHEHMQMMHKNMDMMDMMGGSKGNMTNGDMGERMMMMERKMKMMQEMMRGMMTQMEMQAK